MAEMEPRYVFPLSFDFLPSHSLRAVQSCSMLDKIPGDYESSLKFDNVDLQEFLNSKICKISIGEDMSRPPGTFHSLPEPPGTRLASPPGLSLDEGTSSIPMGLIPDYDPAGYQWWQYPAAGYSPPALSSYAAVHDPIRLDVTSEKPQRKGRDKHSKEQEEGADRRNQKAEDLTEEDWIQREEKRADPVKALKATSEYLGNQDYEPRPVTPDPAGRLTKRHWESEIRQWRNDWREIDAVRKLIGLGFEESASRVAWRSAKETGKQPQLPHDQEAQVQATADLLRIQMTCEEEAQATTCTSAPPFEFEGGVPPSRGSQQHPHSCEACRFYQKGLCHAGDECKLCHVDGCTRSRKSPGRRERRARRAKAAEAAAASASVEIESLENMFELELQRDAITI